MNQNAPPRPGTWELARTPDGYLWLGAVGGLLRFDGIRFTWLDASTFPALSSTRGGEFRPQLVDRQGTLWITRPDGALITWSDRRFAVVLTPDAMPGTSIAEDGSGRLWLFGNSSGTLHHLRNGVAVRADLPTSAPDTGILSVVRDNTGTGIWIGTRSQGLWHVSGRSASYHASPVRRHPNEVRPLFQSRDGALWAIGIGLGTGLHRYLDGRWTRIIAPEYGEGLVRGRALVDGDSGAVFIATHGSGLLQWTDGNIEQFTEADGLSDANTHDVLLDHEGALWIATEAGLDRFRKAVFATVGRADGLPFDNPHRLVQDSSGAVWATGAPDRQLYRLDGGVIAGRAARVTPNMLRLPGGDSYALLGAARGGGIWIGPHRGGLLRHRDGRTTRHAAPGEFAGSRITRAIEDVDGSLWLVLDRTGFGRLRNGTFEAIHLPGSHPGKPVRGFARDSAGNIWASVEDSPFLFQLSGDSIAHRLGPAGGMSDAVVDITAGAGDTLWAATMSSLVRVVGTTLNTIAVPTLAPLLAARARLETAQGRLWVASEAGIASVSIASLNTAAAGGAAVPEVRMFNSLDGLHTPRTTASNPMPIARTRDGRLWFSTPGGLAVMNSAHASSNRVPPAVHVEEVALGGRRLSLDSMLTLAAQPDRVAFRFTAASLLIPERVRVQYMLEGVGEVWQDGGASRVAEYTQLRPGPYRFRVRAWNEDGVPALAEATLQFRVLPAWYQTWWFRALAMFAVAGSGFAGASALQRKRQQRAIERAQARFDAMLSERTRIAREVHDTLLQGFTGITLQLEALRQAMPRSVPQAKSLSTILKAADATLREARDAVWDLRSTRRTPADLATALQEVSQRSLRGESVQLRHIVRGTRRKLPTEVEDAVLRVAGQAVANAVRHGSAQRIDIELTYKSGRVDLTVKDDGRGTSSATIEAAHAAGHWGIAGMRERAQLLGGSFDIVSEVGSGTTIVLSIPSGEPLDS